MSESTQEIEREGALTTLRHGGRTIYILGTAHVSATSIEEVERHIEELRPESVAVELDANRLEALTDESRWRRLDVFQIIRQRKVPLLLVNLALSAYQARIGESLGVRPGAEMLAAVRRAEESGAELVLADRDIQVTLRRTWRGLSFFQKLKLSFGLLSSVVFDEAPELSAEEIEKLKREGTLDELLEELAQAFPAVKRPLIDERDAYLAARIAEAPGQRVLAVVGAAHVPGILRHLEAGVTDTTPLEVVPPAGKLVAVLKWALPAIVLSAFAWGFYKHQGEGLQEMLLAWLIPNSVLAALFAALAGARLLSIATAFFASPITSLNPTIAAGMVVGLLEAWLRKPTVEDCESLRGDVQSLRGFYRNPVSRVLLVSFFTSLGSALGGYVGATWVVTLLG